MADFIWSTIQLYRQAAEATLISFARGWILTIVVMLFGLFMIIVASLVAPLGMAGGLMLGAANALVIGATLNLTEQAVLGGRPIRWSDLPHSAGQYFWDVISVGFLVWFPLLILQMALQSNPYQSVLTTAIFLLVFLVVESSPGSYLSGPTWVSIRCSSRKLRICA